MRFLKQFSIIVTISFLGEVLNHLIPFPIPASIYGLVLMFLCLRFKIFPISAVKETSTFFIQIMPILFVAPTVSLVLATDYLKMYWWQFIVIAVISTFLVMAVSGWVTQLVIQRKKSKAKNATGNAADEANACNVTKSALAEANQCAVANAASLEANTLAVPNAASARANEATAPAVPHATAAGANSCAPEATTTHQEEK